MTSVVVQFHSRLRYFNSHPHEEDDPTAFKALDTISIFQLTSSRRGWRKRSFLSESSSNFNSHPHEEDDEESNKHSNACDISTHILTKRMTATSVFTRERGIFQLTSSRRGWRVLWGLYDRKDYFNSHPHEEDDRVVDDSHSLFTIFQLTSSRRGWQQF